MNSTPHDVPPRPPQRSPLGRAVLVPSLAAFVALACVVPSCASPEDRTIIVAGAPDGGMTPPSFTPEDAGASGPEPTALTEYCPTTECPLPFRTCPSSQYPCDVNLMTDPKNCGSCGFECKGSGNALVDCVGGKCTFHCLTGGAHPSADCNGIVDDDCEVSLGTNDNCNACGDRCADADKPCIYDTSSGIGRCGCDPGLLACASPFGNVCVDPTEDDGNCGACGSACDPAGDGGTPPSHMYYGCLGSQCGGLKCAPPYADCDHDLSNGCETSLVTDESCGACGAACAPGKTCHVNPSTHRPECACPEGLTLCGDDCVNITTDPVHCGSCGISCAGELNNNIDVCVYGSCERSCKQGWGDCNGDLTDGCESNLLSDQRNCGACGNACDALAGQPCVAGQCAVRPCGEGEEAR